MKIACVGGGPGGLFFAGLAKRFDPSLQVTVYERNRPDDTFGFGVVFSDATLATLAAADDVLADRLASRGEYWDRISVRLKGQSVECGGNGMAAIARRELLLLLTERAVEAGVDIKWQHDVGSVAEVEGADLIVASDGANSRVRDELSEAFGLRVDTATAKFIWFGTTYRFDGLSFLFERDTHGVFAVHGYPIGPTLGTFIVETDEESWRRAGLDEFDTSQPSGPSDMKTKAYMEQLFADQIEGHPLVVNNSRWANFRTIRSERWSSGNVVLLGDAAHTAHFSVGSGTKMAMEDAAVLADQLSAHSDDLPRALQQYEADRRPRVEHIQDAARPSLDWWEHFGDHYQTYPPAQFAFHFLTRSISHDRIKARDPEFVAAVHEWWGSEHESIEPLLAEITVEGVGSVGRTATIGFAEGAQVTAFFDQIAVPLLRCAPPEQFEGPWGLLVAAGDDDSGSAELPDRTPSFLAIAGGSGHGRSMTADTMGRLAKLPIMVIDDEFSEDRALTLLLSGRADLVGVGHIGKQ